MVGPAGIKVAAGVPVVSDATRPASNRPTANNQPARAATDTRPRSVRRRRVAFASSRGVPHLAGGDGLLPAREPVPRLRGAARAGLPRGGARRRHRRLVLLRRRRLHLGPHGPRRGSSRGRCCRRDRRLPHTRILFLLQLAMILWCYLAVVFTDPGAVPENWRHDAEDSGNPSFSSSEEQGSAPRYCSRCQNGKPPRCHHCSVCNRCVLKMDHHCIWVVNCVGARNYKYFLLFLVYTFIETVLDTLVLLPNFIEFFQDESRRYSSPGDIATLFLAFVLNLAFALSLLCFIGMHASLVTRNTTSIEVYERKKSVSWKYDLGWKRNLEQVFGTKKLLLFVPLYSTEDLHNIPALQGLEFPTRSDVIV